MLFESPVTSVSRRVPAYWNIATAQQSPVSVLNWWATWPVEPVLGAVVSERIHYERLPETAIRIGRVPVLFFGAASHACVGGYSWAPLVAAICHPAMAPVGLLLAVLGNVLGTYLRLAVAQLLDLCTLPRRGAGASRWRPHEVFSGDMKGVVSLVERACDGVDGLQAAIVFGSALASEKPHDLDLALLWSEDVPARERWRRANRVAGQIEHAMGATALNVDVKDLRALPLVLQHRVLQAGQVAYLADRRALVRFNSETVPRALDFLPFYRRMLEASARRLAGK